MEGVDASFSSFLRAEEKDKSGVWGYPPARDVSRCVSMAMVFPSVRLSLTVCGRAKLRCVNAGESCKGWCGMAKLRCASRWDEKSRDEPCFCVLARLFGRKTSEIIQASFTPELGIVQLMVKPVLNLLPALFIDEGLDLLPNAEEVLDLTDTTVITERHFL